MSERNIPFVDLQAQYSQIKDELESEVLEVLRSCGYIAGKRVAGFESTFAEMHAATHCIGVNSGTAALHLALWGMGIGPGDEVILPVNTYIATAEAVSLTGATPVFIDHNEFFNMNTDCLKNKVTESTRAVIAVHLYGQPANMPAIADFCKSNNLKLIEDCAQSHLAKFNNQPISTFGDAGCFSFYPGKNLGACGEAGAVVTNDQELYEIMLQLRQHGVSTDKYFHHRPGHNYRMEEMQAAALSVKAKHIADWTEARIRNAGIYSELLSDIDEVETPMKHESAKHVYHLYVIQADDREGLMKHLAYNKIASGLHYPTPLHLQPAYSCLGHKAGDFPTAEAACGRILSLPMFPELTREDIEYVCSSIKAFYAQG